ncbi:hypothetical protein OAP83_02800 [Rickettsiales bacterium]|nr:hypothetical protein [Rickettsiales bacterium]
MKNLLIYSLLSYLINFNFVIAGPNTQFAEQELVFSGRMRSAKLTLINRGDVTSTVTLDFLQPIYKERTNDTHSDSYQMFNVKEIELDYFPYNLKLKNALRITPRRVTLKPGEKQAVRLVLKKPVDLIDGVYRANVAVNYVDVVHEELDNLKPEKDKVAVGMGFVTSVHIPLLIIHGDVQTTLDEFKILSIKKKPLDKITRMSNSIVSLLFDTSGNSLGQYIVKMYTDVDADSPIYNKTVEISNFITRHIKSYSVNIDDKATQLRVVIEELGSKKVIQDVTTDIENYL